MVAVIFGTAALGVGLIMGMLSIIGAMGAVVLLVAGAVVFMFLPRL